MLDREEKLKRYTCLFRVIEFLRLPHSLIYLCVNKFTGWDTDQFLTDPMEATLVALAIIRQGGLSPGGINFDAKLRRESTDPEDLLIAHIASMDAMARGLRNAARLIEDGILDSMVNARYSSWKESKLGKDIQNGKVGFVELEKYALQHGDPMEQQGGVGSGKQELFEMILSNYVR